MLLCVFFLDSLELFMVLILRRLTEIKRKECDVKQSCSPVSFSCSFIFIQATFRLRSIYFGLFMLSKPVELWPFLVQTQQGTPLTALSFRFTFLLHLVRHLLMFFFSPIFLLFFWDTPSSMCQLEDVGGEREGARSVWELHIDSYWHLPPCRPVLLLPEESWGHKRASKLTGQRMRTLTPCADCMNKYQVVQCKRMRWQRGRAVWMEAVNE